ncbi:hypothetical protein GDO78_018475 [Eleutherodactylus coqui]|uniref:UPAR/Ly6 domain-containing protein n=1 Tax=Eleutherodactylus coqui TaxID=57060 RepID=A0A8J6EJ15_ELECQ|nr:hypothetical protein GDO78_018475 [Eleutherodactylus coqui]
MATYRSLLLVAALCMDTVYSLRCYTCAAQNSNANCMTATNCSATDNYCMTSVVAGGIVGFPSIRITKACVHNCTSTNDGTIITSSNVTCCSTDLCNYSGGASIRSSCAAIILALGSVLIILKSSVL